MAYHRGSSLVVQREYSYDALGRPTARNTARQGAVVNDIFAHNTRSELSSARVNGVSYGYAYDNIGNRLSSSSSAGTEIAYTYTPFGEVTASGSVTQPIQWSSELHDAELGIYVRLQAF